jgi:hypothetical protein
LFHVQACICYCECCWQLREGLAVRQLYGHPHSPRKLVILSSSHHVQSLWKCPPTAVSSWVMSSCSPKACVSISAALWEPPHQLPKTTRRPKAFPLCSNPLDMFSELYFNIWFSLICTTWRKYLAFVFTNHKLIWKFYQAYHQHQSNHLCYN